MTENDLCPKVYTRGGRVCVGLPDVGVLQMSTDSALALVNLLLGTIDELEPGKIMRLPIRQTP